MEKTNKLVSKEIIRQNNNITIEYQVSEWRNTDGSGKTQMFGQYVVTDSVTRWYALNEEDAQTKFDVLVEKRDLQF